jgi:hypothetical protein
VRELRDKAEDINKEIFRLWVKGKGLKPVSWATLVDVLQDIELNSLAAAIRETKCSMLQWPCFYEHSTCILLHAAISVNTTIISNLMQWVAKNYGREFGLDIIATNSQQHIKKGRVQGGGGVHAKKLQEGPSEKEYT